MIAALSDDVRVMFQSATDCDERGSLEIADQRVAFDWIFDGATLRSPSRVAIERERDAKRNDAAVPRCDLSM
jgi:hypothetical protein